MRSPLQKQTIIITQIRRNRTGGVPYSESHRQPGGHATDVPAKGAERWEERDYNIFILERRECAAGWPVRLFFGDCSASGDIVTKGNKCEDGGPAVGFAGHIHGSGLQGHHMQMCGRVMGVERERESFIYPKGLLFFRTR